MTERTAKEFLRSKGYFVDNLWHISDVQNKFVCTDEEAQDTLYWSLATDSIIEQINERIQDCGMMSEFETR